MTLSIIHNLGLGDHIICAPIVARIASQTSGKVMLPCWKHNRESVASFFVNYPNVLVMPIEKESELREFEPAIRLGHYSDMPRGDNEDFISWFYRQADFPLEDREKWCPLAKATKGKIFNMILRAERNYANRLVLNDSPFAFVHEDNSRGFGINPKYVTDALPWEFPRRANSILQYWGVLKTASEIHCIDSSFLHLADALPTTGKLFFHRYARAGEHNKGLALRKQWEVLE